MSKNTTETLKMRLKTTKVLKRTTKILKKSMKIIEEDEDIEDDGKQQFPKCQSIVEAKLKLSVMYDIHFLSSSFLQLNI